MSMDWLSGNSFFLIILLLCVGMHLFHGHGDHGGDGNADEEDGRCDRHKHE
jgi:Protein of unknown function (DUF2933)